MFSDDHKIRILVILTSFILSCSVPGGITAYSFTDPISIHIIIQPRAKIESSDNTNSVEVLRTVTLILKPISTPTLTPSPTSTNTLTPSPSSSSTATRTISPTETETQIPTETEFPTVDEEPLPEIALIEGVVGYPQESNLDCEARSAVDFAGYFGVPINEMEFQENLPHSDDPEEGFVGNYWDARGQLPPESYGVHARPVADLLRIYGINAWDKKGFTYEDLQKEIAAGRPIIAWVVGNTESGDPISYTATNGNTTTVARFEHTVIVIGYQPSYVTLVDGGMTYHRAVDTFLNSWRVLGNMAIVNQTE